MDSVIVSNIRKDYFTKGCKLLLDSSRLIVKEYIDDLKDPGGYMSDDENNDETDDETDDEKDDETDDEKDDETGEVNPNLIYKDDDTDIEDDDTKVDDTKDKEV